MKKRLDLIFPTSLIQQPVVCQMARRFDVVFNIRRAKINEKVGQMVLELEGNEPALTQAMDWLKSQDIKVEPVTHDTIEG